MRKMQTLLTLVLLLAAARIWSRSDAVSLDDFKVYRTAAALVASHRGAALYEGADTGADPQLRFADPGSLFARQARAIGIPRVRLYLYPPLLADLMVPFSGMSPHVADVTWLALDALLLLGSAGILARMLLLPPVSPGMAALLLAAAVQFPTWHAVVYGQITILLLFLITVAVDGYGRGKLWLSAAFLAVATAIKLTSALLILPILLWKDWRWLRRYAVWIALLAALLCLVNGPSVLADYFRHVVPPMSAGFPDFENKSLLSGLQVLYLSFHAGRLVTGGPGTPHAVLLLGKLLSAAVLACAALLVFRRRHGISLADRRLTLALFALLSVCIAPVSWSHAYVIQLLPLAMLWAEQLRGNTGWASGLWLTCASAELAANLFESVGMRILPGALPGTLALAAPLVGIALVLSRLSQMGRPAPQARPAAPGPRQHRAKAHTAIGA